MMYGLAIAAVLVAMAVALVRVVLGPTVYDRILAVNSFGTMTVLFIALHGFFEGRPEFLDIAMVYALISFVSTIAVSKFVVTSGRWRRVERAGKEDV